MNEELRAKLVGLLREEGFTDLEETTAPNTYIAAGTASDGSFALVHLSDFKPSPRRKWTYATPDRGVVSSPDETCAMVEIGGHGEHRG